jgi:hypothetical protein
MSEIVTRMKTTHGATIGHKDGKRWPTEYTAWQRAKSRCHNPKDKSYPRYAGRGIEMCEKWRNSYEAFLADVGPKPAPHLTLDRINNNGNYEPGNVRWATWSQQRINSRPRPWENGSTVGKNRRGSSTQAKK